MSTESVDVLVVGAGASGIPAAIAAARAGANVMLLEEDHFPGGAPVDSYIAMPCGGPRRGIYAELVARLQRDHRLPSLAANHGRREEDWYLPWAYQEVWSELIAAEPNLRLVCGARAVRPTIADRAGGPCVTGVAIATHGGELRIEAGVTIDATGSGALARLGGCQEMYGYDAQSAFNEPHAPPQHQDLVQQCTLMFISQRLGDKPFDMRRLKVVGMIDPGFGWVGKGAEEFVARDSGFYLHWGCALQCADTRDELAVAATQQKALEMILPDLRTLRDNGFFAYVAPRLGVRESRRIVGEYVLNENDVRAGAMPDDTIAVGSWYLDIWGQTLAKEAKTVPAYGIPYRCLLPRGVDGLLLAGKAISGSHIAMSSYRVQPTVAMIGQAAGVAAAIASRKKCQPRDVDVRKLRRQLLAAPQGVDLTAEKDWIGVNA